MLEVEPVPGSQFITITLPPRAYKHKAAKQHKLVKSTIYNIMRVHCKDFCIIAELTEQANVHYHGWFTEAYEHAMLFMLDNFKEVVGFVKVNKERITHVKRTYDYMRKDMANTAKIIGKNIVISNNIRSMNMPHDVVKQLSAERLEQMAEFLNYN